MAVKSKLVCIVDDEASVRRALTRLIHQHGYDTMAFSSGRECLDGHEIDRAGVVIIDVSMPGMDGFELHTLLRASGRKIPTIFMSAHTDRQYGSRAKSVDAITYLNKPCNQDDLLSAIDSVIESGSTDSAAGFPAGPTIATSPRRLRAASDHGGHEGGNSRERLPWHVAGEVHRSDSIGAWPRRANRGRLCPRR